MLHPGESPKIPYLTQCLQDDPGVVVAASDYVKALPDSISQWVPNPMTSLGTDGFGLSETREALRDHFEVDARFITLSVLTLLAREGAVDREVVGKAILDLKIDPEKENPATR